MLCLLFIFFLNEELSNYKVVLLTRKEYTVIFFANLHKVFKANIRRMIDFNLLKPSLNWNFHNKVVHVSLIFFNLEKWNFVIKAREMFTFLLLMNNAVTIDWRFFLLSIPAIISSNTPISCIFYLDCICQYFHKYHSYHSSIQ